MPETSPHVQPSWNDRHPTHPTTSETLHHRAPEPPPPLLGRARARNLWAEGIRLTHPSGITSAVDACHSGGRRDVASPPNCPPVYAPDLTRGPGTRIWSDQTQDRCSRQLGLRLIPTAWELHHQRSSPYGARHCVQGRTRTTRAGSRTHRTRSIAADAAQPCPDWRRDAIVHSSVAGWLAPAPHSDRWRLGGEPKPAAQHRKPRDYPSS